MRVAAAAAPAAAASIAAVTDEILKPAFAS